MGSGGCDGRRALQHLLDELVRSASIQTSMCTASPGTFRRLPHEVDNFVGDVTQTGQAQIQMFITLTLLVGGRYNLVGVAVFQ